MISLIIKKEIQDIVTSRKFVITFAVSSVLIILSFYAGANNYFMQQRQYESALTENIRQMQGITDWRHISHSIFLPPNPLHTLVNGISNDIGRDIEIYGIGELTAENSRYNDEPLYAVFRFLDLEFLFAVILSLFAIVYGYNMINGEKESGTLKLVFANSLSKDQFILGKLCGALLAAAVPLAVPFLLGALLLIILGVPLFAAGWINLALIILSGFLLFSLFLTLSIFISAVTRSSSTAFLYLLVIWIFSVLIIPRTAVLLAGRTADVPSIDETASQKYRLRIQLFTEQMKKLRDFKAENTADVQKMAEEFQKYMAVLTEERSKKQDSFNRKLNEDRRNKQIIQEKLALNLARISPVSVFSLAALNLAGTSIDLKQAYNNSADTYQQLYASFLRSKLDGSLPEAGVVMRTINHNADIKPVDPHELPVFEFLEGAAGSTFQAAAADFAVLLVFNLLFFMGAVYAFIRYDLR